MLNLRLPIPALALGLLLALPACKTGDSPASGSTAHAGSARLSNELVTQVEVVAVEPSERIVTLRREDGSQFRVKAGEAVRNFAQIAVGDALRVKYRETLEATRLPEGSSVRPAALALGAGGAKQGAKPAGGVGLAVSVRVQITSIDREHGVVVFALPSGELIARTIVTPEGREFVKGLEVGDVVQLDYTEVLALSIEKL